MAQFDRLLAAMVSNKADSLVLEDGDLVKVEIAGQLRPLTKAPLTASQIVALLKEIAPAEAKQHIEANKPATMAYVSGDGAFTIRAMLHGTKWHVVAKIDDAEEFKRVTGQFKAMDVAEDGAPGQSTQAAQPAPSEPPSQPQSRAPSPAPQPPSLQSQ